MWLSLQRGVNPSPPTFQQHFYRKLQALNLETSNPMLYFASFA